MHKILKTNVLKISLSFNTYVYNLKASFNFTLTHNIIFIYKFYNNDISPKNYFRITYIFSNKQLNRCSLGIKY